MNKTMYKIMTIEQMIEAIGIKNKDIFLDAIEDLMQEDYSETGIKYVMSMYMVQRKLSMYDNDKLGNIFKNEVRKYAFKKNDERWNDRNKRIEEKKAADQIRKEITVNKSVEKSKLKTDTGYVYFIQPENGGPIKIGYSKNVKNRLTTLQTSNAYKLVVIGEVNAPMVAEQKLHMYLKHAKTYGEWFEPDEIVLETIKKCLEHGFEYIKKLE